MALTSGTADTVTSSSGVTVLPRTGAKFWVRALATVDACAFFSGITTRVRPAVPVSSCATSARMSVKVFSSGTRTMIDRGPASIVTDWAGDCVPCAPRPCRPCPPAA